MTTPYPLTNDPDTGIYSFVTDNQTSYVCRFRNCTHNLSPLVGIYDIEIYDFEFYKGDGARVVDHRVACTISTLLHSFFINENRVIIYVCDSSDGKDNGRSKLFRKWHGTHLLDKLEAVPVEINLEDDLGVINTIYGGALIRQDFPHMDILRKEVLVNAHEILQEKYGDGQ